MGTRIIRTVFTNISSLKNAHTNTANDIFSLERTTIPMRAENQRLKTYLEMWRDTSNLSPRANAPNLLLLAFKKYSIVWNLALHWTHLHDQGKACAKHLDV